MSVDRTGLLKRTADLALEFLDGLPERRVGPVIPIEELRASLGGPLPEQGEDPRAVIEDLFRGADPGLVAMAGPRYFGFVTGGHVPAALAADWLTSTWDQNASLHISSPTASVVEEVAAGWLLEVLGLPRPASVGFTTGCTMANFTALAAARHAVLARLGWDVERRGLYGAPEIDVVVGEEAHATLHAALQMLGLGRERVKRAATDDQGRMREDSLREVLKGCRGPLIVCAQAGNVNTGSFDPLEEIADLVHNHRGAGGWLHVDGAFGLWAAASPSLAPLVQGAGLADSWATDGHKWLNVPYDSGIVIVKDPEAHRQAMTIAAPYLATGGSERNPFDYVPEASRRARGFTVWAALRSLGRQGIAELVERCCALAKRFEERLRREPGVEILNDVVLNQVLVRFHPPDGGDADAFTREVVTRVQADGTCWLGGTIWHGMAAMRISVSNWSTSEEDVDQSAAAILRAVRT
ncbi:MAG TPA: aminotransferase class V-fold PLP-dependent enzyme [Thermoanaerobaculia bacterium]|jgi:glutamate/tyrosine decarboxylase-like PLP-dependent enzyme|nr:aminotransferase class V-fold PLP-dependent enzyme [Thermoanaerobaculia bacterium]